MPEAEKICLYCSAWRSEDDKFGQCFRWGDPTDKRFRKQFNEVCNFSDGLRSGIGARG